MKFEPDKMRERFKALSDQRASILEASSPLREKRDKLLAKQQREVEELNNNIRTAERELYDIDVELGMISRALGGLTAVQKEQ